MLWLPLAYSNDVHRLPGFQCGAPNHKLFSFEQFLNQLSEIIFFMEDLAKCSSRENAPVSQPNGTASVTHLVDEHS